ncbi:hypothetical protein CRENBAI_026306 [Crenichthys baileyi]|uniref:Uncharacterized protein n=1 Tax=Crenichthys baileyi TaxID=28760 RepID=A0AAV9R2H9_9TELE
MDWSEKPDCLQKPHHPSRTSTRLANRSLKRALYCRTDKKPFHISKPTPPHPIQETRSTVKQNPTFRSSAWPNKALRRCILDVNQAHQRHETKKMEDLITRPQPPSCLKPRDIKLARSAPGSSTIYTSSCNHLRPAQGPPPGSVCRDYSRAVHTIIPDIPSTREAHSDSYVPSLHLSVVNSHVPVPGTRQKQDGDESAYRQEVDRVITLVSVQNCPERNPLTDCGDGGGLRDNTPPYTPLTSSNKHRVGLWTLQFLRNHQI